MRNPDDAVIARTRAAAQRLLMRARSVPLSQRVAFINRELVGLDPELPARVAASVVTLMHKGYTTNDALARAIEVEAANALLNHFVKVGKSVLSGVDGLGGLGGLGSAAGDFVTNLLGGAACSTALRDVIVTKVGNGSGPDAAAYATAGADALRGAAKCNKAAATPAAPPPAPPPPPPPPKMPIWPFVAGGVALLGVGVVFMATR